MRRILLWVALLCFVLPEVLKAEDVKVTLPEEKTDASSINTVEFEKSEDFKKADIVFVGTVLEVHEAGPVLSRHGPRITTYFAELETEVPRKGELRPREIVAISYPFDDRRKQEFTPLLQKGKKYLVFGKKVPASYSGNVSGFNIGSYYYITSKADGTVDMKY